MALAVADSLERKYLRPRGLTWKMLGLRIAINSDDMLGCTQHDPQLPEGAVEQAFLEHATVVREVIPFRKGP